MSDLVHSSQLRLSDQLLTAQLIQQKYGARILRVVRLGCLERACVLYSVVILVGMPSLPNKSLQATRAPERRR